MCLDFDSANLWKVIGKDAHILPKIYLAESTADHFHNYENI